MEMNLFYTKNADTDAVTAVLNPPTPVTAMAEPNTTPVSEPPKSDLFAAVSAALDGTLPAVPATSSAEKPTSVMGPLDLLPEIGDPVVNKTKIIVKALRGMEQSISSIIRLLEEQGPSDMVATLAMDTERGMRNYEMASIHQAEGRVTEGVFDGREMIGSDGKPYAVPPNYASKSKLVEGDLLKLTITPKGSFIYKQTGPIERSRVMASLGFDQTTGEWYGAEGDKRWSVLKASVTFFKGEQDDEVILLIPKTTPSKWAAVENIIKKNPLA